MTTKLDIDDDGRLKSTTTIAEAWKGFWEKIKPEDPHPEQERAMRDCFYGGYAACQMILDHMGRDKTLDEDSGTRLLQDRIEEIEAYVDRVKGR